MNGLTIQSDCGEGSEGEERCRESLSLLKEYLSGYDQKIGGNNTVKVILTMSKMKMMNIYLETGGKVNFAISGK